MPSAPVNWGPYEQDILRLYVEQDKTAVDTLSCLNRQHGTRFTLRQFKAKFGGLKNLRGHEWQEVHREFCQRKDQGKESEVYLFGQRLDSVRIQRSISHARKCGNLSTVGAEENVELFGRRRLEIRTPPPPNSPVVNALNPRTVPQQPLGNNSRVTDARFTHQVETTLDDFFVDLDASTDTVDGMDFDFSVIDTNHTLQTDTLRNSDLFGEDEIRSSQTVTLDNPTFFLSEHHQLTSQPESRLSPLAPLTTIMPTQESLVNGFWSRLPQLDLFGGSNWPSTFEWSQSSGKAPMEKCGWLENQLVGASPGLQVDKRIIKVLEDISQNPGIMRKELRFDGQNKEVINQLFSVVTCLVANTLLTGRPLFHFVECVLQSGFTAQFNEFLQQPLPQVYNFIRQILEMISCEAREAYGNQPPTKASLILRHPIEVMYLMRAADKRTLLSGGLGGKLLIHFVEMNHLDAVSLLLDRGVNINYVVDSTPGWSINGAWRLSRPKFPNTALCAAIFARSIDMLNYLLKCGADVNVKFRSKDGMGSALTEAVRIGSADMTKILLDSGANASKDLIIDGSSIHKYAEERSPNIFKLLEDGLELGLTDDIIENPLPLVEAAEKGNNSLSKFLGKHGIFRQETLEAGLCHAAKIGNTSAVLTFLYRDVDPNALRYRNSLQIGRIRGHKEEIERSASEIHKQPIYSNESIDQDIESDHPLYQSCRRGFDDVVYLLVDAGAKVTEKTLLKICLDQLYQGIYALQQLVVASLDIEITGPAALVLCGYKNKSISECAQILSTGVDINAYGACGKSALQAACLGDWQVRTDDGHLNLVRYFVAKGAKVNLPASKWEKMRNMPVERSEYGLTALQAAARGGNSHVVDFLIDAGADVKAPPAEGGGFTVLEGAAAAFEGIFRLGRGATWELISTYKMLLVSGALVDRNDGIDSTVLHSLIRGSQIQCLRWTLEAGANIEARDEYHGGMTPLQVAALCGHLEAMQVLVDHGAKVDAPASSKRMGYTALQAAIMHGAVPDYGIRNTGRWEATKKAIDFLLRCSLNVNAPAGDSYGRTALQATLSCPKPDAELVALLLSHGANVNAPPAKTGGITALQGAAISGDIQIARMLLACGADVNAPAAAKEGRTAIEAAAEHGRLDMIHLLCAQGAVPDGEAGFSKAIGFAESNRRFDIVDTLKAYEQSCGYI